MKCEFSETRFVFGILHELANRCFATGRGWKAPNLPTQGEEKELGYDVEITGAVRSIFFQFKIPEKRLLQTRNTGTKWVDRIMNFIYGQTIRLRNTIICLILLHQIHAIKYIIVLHVFIQTENMKLITGIKQLHVTACMFPVGH